MINWRKPIIFLLLYLSGSKIPRNLELIKKLDKLSVEEKKKYQEKKLKELLLHAYKNVPYYSKILKKSKVVIDNKIYLENFKNIPILTKDIIRKEGENMYSADYKDRKPYENTSGGSTGEPVRFLQDKNYNDWAIATKLFIFNAYFGKKIGEPEINLWGSERDIYKNTLSAKERIINFLYNRTFLNAFKVNHKKLNFFVDKINIKKPISMWVYVESIDLLDRHINDNKLNVFSPKFIISTAGTLYKEIRERVQKTFNCSVYNQYGSREVSLIATECKEQDGLHIFPWHNMVEVIDKKIIVTNLNNYTMPLIRYEIGDTGGELVVKKCDCGREGFVLSEVIGRTISHFKTRGGDVVHAQYMIHQFYFRSWVKKFQIIQKDYDLILCRILLNKEKNVKDIFEIEKNIKLVMGSNCKINWDFVDNIESTKSGKYLYTICEIK